MGYGVVAWIKSNAKGGELVMILISRFGPSISIKDLVTPLDMKKEVKNIEECAVLDSRHR